ncbi:MAG: ABC transporter substrate-binding protein [Sedimentisphaerales bacterium]
MNKKIMSISIIILVIVIVLLYFISSSERKKSGTINIGLMLPLTGSVAQWGTPSQDAARLAVEQINMEMGGVKGRTVKLKLVIEDDQCDPAIGVSAIHKFLSTDKPIAIIGSICSSVVLAVAPILEKNEVVLISPGATNPAISDAGDYIFRVIPPDDLRGRIFAEYVYSIGHRIVSALYINNDSGVGNKNAFAKRFEELGGKIVSEETYSQDSTDMRSQITKIKAAKPDGVLVVSYPTDTPLIMRQCEELELNLPLFFQTEALDDPAVIKPAGEAAEGATYILSATPTGSTADAFRKAFEEKYGRAPETYAAETFDAVKIIAKIIEESDTVSSRALKDGLYKIVNYNGASGIISFNAKGDVSKPMAIKQIKNGRSVVIKTSD